jgi:hypothetical protein
MLMSIGSGPGAFMRSPVASVFAAPDDPQRQLERRCGVPAVCEARRAATWSAAIEVR